MSVPSSTSTTRTYAVDTSSFFNGMRKEFQVQSYNDAGDSPWSDVANAELLNRDKILLTISPDKFTIKQGGTASYTVVANSDIAGTVVLRDYNSDVVTVDPTSLTFTTENARTPQTVTATGVKHGFGRSECTSLLHIDG